MYSSNHAVFLSKSYFFLFCLIYFPISCFVAFDISPIVACGISYYLWNPKEAIRRVTPKRILDGIIWLVDRWHAGNKHNMKPNDEYVQVLNRWCNLNCDLTGPNKDDLLAAYPGLSDENGKSVGNSEAAEQKMNVVGNFAHVTMSMNFWKQKFFLLWLSCDLNESWTMAHEGKVHSWQTPKPNVNL